jgi:hypothetical protein
LERAAGGLAPGGLEEALVREGDLAVLVEVDPPRLEEPRQLVVDPDDHAKEVAGLLLDVGARERADVGAGDQAVGDQRFAEGRDPELPRLEDVEEEAVGRALLDVLLLHVRELLEDQLLALPEGREPAQAVPFLVNPTEALGEPREVEDHPHARQRDEAGLVLGERPGELPRVGVDRLHRGGGQGRRVVDRILGQAVGKGGGELPEQEVGVFGDEIRVIHMRPAGGAASSGRAR